MGKRKHDENGFSAVEGLLILLIIGIIGFVGWYVMRAKNDTDNNLGAAANSSQTAGNSGKSGNGTDNQSLENNLNGINTSSNQTTKDLSASDSSLHDNSTFTSLP